MMKSKARVGPFRSNTLMGAIRSPSWIASSAHGVQAGHRAADVGPVGEVDGERDEPAAREHRPDRLHVRQVVAAHLGKVQVPDVPVAELPPRHPPRNSFTVNPITPRWIGMSRPWAISRPRASVSALERSPPP